VYGCVFTQSVSNKEIETVAINFYALLTGTENAKIIKQDEHYFNNTHTYSTVVFLNNDWMIVSTDKQAEPILAYSESGNYNDSIAPGAMFWLSQYDSYVYDIKQKGAIDDEINYLTLWDELIRNDLDKYKKNKGVVVAPLITTKWGQSTSNSGGDTDAYNFYTPSAPGCNHTLAGCPAVAVGQVLRYWKYPYCSLFDWSKMPNELNTNDPNYNQYKEEIANLLRNIGDKMNSNGSYYGCLSSGCATSITHDVLLDDFIFNSALIERINYKKNTWKNILCNNLNENRPVLYRGVNYSGGHIFVCDGYKTVTIGEKFHFNYGWNGSSDGYYRINNPSGFSNDQKAIINIYPFDCNSTISIYQNYKYSVLSGLRNAFYNPEAGNIYSSPVPIIIEDGDNVHYKAYNEIVLENFETENGAEFVAEIIPCPTNCNFTNYKGSKLHYNISDITNKQNIDSLQTNNEISIYPNPSNGVFFIQSNLDDNNGVIRVYNPYGKLILEKNIIQNNNKIDLSDCSSGIYVAIYTSNKLHVQQKIIKK
jgi:hypothetical protein